MKSFTGKEIEYFGEIRDVNSLLKKPIESDLDRIQNQLSGLAFSEYKSFLSNLKTVQDAQLDFNSILQRVQGLEEELIDFSNKIKSLESNSKMANNIQLLNSQQESLLEIINIPNTIDTMSKNGSFDDAIQLYTFVTTVLIKRYHNLKIIQAIHSLTEDATTRMVQRLISGLSGPLKLPSCIRIIGYLKRLGVASDDELKWLFLTYRGQYLELMISQVHGDGDYCKKVLEVHRQVFFDILTM